VYLSTWFVTLIQDVLSSSLLTVVIILALLILRYLVEQQDKLTTVIAKLSIQGHYFVFLFIQLFIIVSIFSSITVFLSEFTYNIKSIAVLIASNLLKISNYFFFYIFLQELFVSAVTFLQINRIVTQVIICLHDKTARQK